MWEKEKGYILSVDPASLSCGASLWKDGQFVASRLISGGSKQSAHSVRYRLQAIAMSAFLFDCGVGVDELKTVIFEDTRSKLLPIGMGVWFTAPQIKATIKMSHFVAPMSWKKWARDNGAVGPIKDVKGLQALREVGWDFDSHPVGTDDEADSILIYRTWAGQA